MKKVDVLGTQGTFTNHGPKTHRVSWDRQTHRRTATSLNVSHFGDEA